MRLSCLLHESNQVTQIENRPILTNWVCNCVDILEKLEPLSFRKRKNTLDGKRVYLSMLEYIKWET